MSLPCEVSRAHMEQEMARVYELGALYKWDIAADLDKLRLRVAMDAVGGERYIAHAGLDDYKASPPLWDFEDPVTGEMGTSNAYPKGHDSFFHSSLCVCAPFSRRAYSTYREGAPHADWNPSDWMASKANGTDWANYSELAGMLQLIQTRLIRPEFYRGRMSAGQ
jgi:hypothetical protein